MTHNYIHIILRSLRSLRHGIISRHPQSPKMVRKMIKAEFQPTQAKRQWARAAVLRQLGEPPQTKYFQEFVRDLDVAIEMQRGDWCYWLVNYTPGYSDLLIEKDRLKHAKTNPKYYKLNRLMKQEKNKKKRNDDDDDNGDDDDGDGGNDWATARPRLQLRQPLLVLPLLVSSCSEAGGRRRRQAVLPK